jgi:hypothetical protein
VEILLPRAPVPIALVGLAVWLIVRRVKAASRPARSAEVVRLYRIVDEQEARIRGLEDRPRANQDRRAA